MPSLQELLHPDNLHYWRELCGTALLFGGLGPLVIKALFNSDIGEDFTDNPDPKRLNPPQETIDNISSPPDQT